MKARQHIPITFKCVCVCVCACWCVGVCFILMRVICHLVEPYRFAIVPVSREPECGKKEEERERERERKGEHAKHFVHTGFQRLVCVCVCMHIYDINICIYMCCFIQWQEPNVPMMGCVYRARAPKCLQRLVLHLRLMVKMGA
jgi:hypothetical protein